MDSLWRFGRPGLCADSVIVLELEPGVKIVTPSEARELTTIARHELPVYEIVVGDPADRDHFFRAVRTVLPLDPPVETSRSWEALADSLFEGLYAVQTDRLLILWRDAYKALAASPRTYEIALDVLDGVARLLGDRGATVGRPKALSVLVVASAP